MNTTWHMRDNDEDNSATLEPVPNDMTGALIVGHGVGGDALAVNQSTRSTDLEGRGREHGLIRWYVVAVLTVSAMLSSMLWNFFSPIHTTAKAVYGFSNSNIAWINNSANIAMLVSIPFTSVAVDVLGVQKPTILSVVLIGLSAALRPAPQIACLLGYTMSNSTVFWVNVASGILNGLAAAWLNFAGPVLSEIWFGANERARVTAILTVAPYVGGSLGFLVGPLCVKPGIEGKASLETLNWVYAGICSAVCLLVVCYFPKQPKQAPSKSREHRIAQLSMQSQGSSASGRLCQAMFGCGRREVATLWIVSFVYGLPLGVFNGWVAILAINLQDVGGLSTMESGWIGCFMTLSGCLAAIASASLNDNHPGRLKKWIIVSNMIASVCFALFCVRALGLWVPESKLLSNVMVFGCSVAGGLFLNLPMPLFYELGVEQSFPIVSGNAASMVVALTTQVVQCLFLAISFVPEVSGDSSRWMDWAMMGVTPLFTLPLIFMRADYRRLRVDRPHIKTSKLDSFGF